jgi:hypothetical protein
VLDEAERAFAKLRDPQGLERVRHLREQIVSRPATSSIPRRGRWWTPSPSPHWCSAFRARWWR